MSDPIMSNTLSSISPLSPGETMSDVQRKAEFGILDIGLSLADWGLKYKFIAESGKSDEIIRQLATAHQYSTFFMGKGIFEYSYNLNTYLSTLTTNNPFNINQISTSSNSFTKTHKRSYTEQYTVGGKTYTAKCNEHGCQCG
jgi:hypothetical protein